MGGACEGAQSIPGPAEPAGRFAARGTRRWQKMSGGVAVELLQPHVQGSWCLVKGVCSVPQGQELLAVTETQIQPSEGSGSS